MPCHFKILPSENLVAKSYFGRVTTSCVLKLIDDFEGDPNYRDGMMEFDDLTGVEDLDITATDISKLADLLRGLGKRRPLRKAVLAPRGPARAAAFGFQKLMEDSETTQVSVFDNLSDASDFLQIKDYVGFSRSVTAKHYLN